MSARDIIKQAFEAEFDDTCSGDAFADKCAAILHEEGYRILAPGEMDRETLEAAAKVAEARKPLYTHPSGRNACSEIASSIRALGGEEG